MKEDLILNIMGTSMDIVLLCYYSKGKELRFIKMGAYFLYFLFGCTILIFNICEIPFAIKISYEIIAIFCLNFYLYQDSNVLQILKLTFLFFLSMSLCELFVVSTSIYIFNLDSLQLFMNNKMLSFQLIILTKAMAFLLLSIVFQINAKNEIYLSISEKCIYFLPIITNLILDFNIINTMETSKNKLATEYSFTLMHISLVSLSSTFCHIILFNLYLNKRAKEKELEFIREHDEKIFDYYRRKLEDEELIKIMRHDLKNQLLVMKHNINGKSEEYIDSLLDELSNVRYEIDTGNVYLDVLLSEKISCIREKDIELSVMVNYKDIDFILDRDVCSLFGNILDNCIEAVEKLETNRLIIFKCNIIQNQLCIHAENTFKDNPQIKNGRFVTTKNNADGHGLGILSIKKIVSNYKGNVTFLVSDKKFVVNINIPISYKV